MLTLAMPKYGFVRTADSGERTTDSGEHPGPNLAFSLYARRTTFRDLATPR